MNSEPRSALAHRMHLLLRRELGQGFDEARLLAEPLYARDVLLVCDALPGPGLALLASQFRQALPASQPRQAGQAGHERPPGQPELPSEAWPPSGADSADSAAHDSLSSLQTASARRAPARGWLSPGRWFGRP